LVSGNHPQESKTMQKQEYEDQRLEAVAASGWGYWDVTSYPYGGCFRRLAANTAVVVTGEAVMKSGREYSVTFADGRKGWIAVRAVSIQAVAK
jgi:hypothetical protein